jgi:hypothetical protein
MNKYILFTVFLLGSFSLVAQISTPTVLANSGEFYNNTNVSLSWTLGEVSINTYNSTSAVLNQGFQQSILSIVSVSETLNPEFTCRVFPNPAKHQIHIIHNATSKLLYLRIMDLQGKEVARYNLSQQNNQIDIQNLAEGIYLLEIANKDNTINTYKLVKHN